MSYPFALWVHLLAAAASLSGFVLRGVWMWRRSPLLRHRVTRVAPHINDTILFGSALWLAVNLGLWPLPVWLICKLAAVTLYIVSGALGLHYAATTGQRKLFFCLALALFSYVVAVAYLKHPLLLI
ncbi:SirB2 family protein [Candidatus Foliamicus sp.]